jgi:uncharacterized membrane protein
MSTIGTIHTATAVSALATGAWVLWRPKGTRAHRQAGWVYAASMLLLNVTALMIYRLTGTFGAFHVAALASLATLVAGVVPAWRRRPATGWLERHYFFMTYSYLGLIAAAMSEAATRIPLLRGSPGRPTATFWITVVVATILVVAGGSRLIRRGATVSLAPFRGARGERAARTPA